MRNKAFILLLIPLCGRIYAQNINPGKGGGGSVSYSALVWTNASGTVSLVGSPSLTTNAPPLDVAGLTTLYGGLIVSNTAYVSAPTNLIPQTATGARFMWIPEKNAIRAGVISSHNWDLTNIGPESVVFGDNNLGAEEWSVVVGGQDNKIEQSAGFSQQSFIGGGYRNDIATNGGAAVIGGGYRNTITGTYSVIGGGRFNTTFGQANFIGSGLNNDIEYNNDYSVIAGGDSNLIATNTSGDYLFIGGGANNTIRKAGNIIYANILAGHNNLAGANETFVIGSKLNNTTATNIDLGFNDNRKTSFGDTNITFRSPVSAPTNTASFTTVAPANLHSVTLGKGWTNDFGVRADLVISVKYTDAATGDPSFAFTNSVTGEAWTNSVAFGLTATTKDTVVIPDISPNDSGSFTDLSGTGASVTFLTAWWKLK